MEFTKRHQIIKTVWRTVPAEIERILEVYSSVPDMEFQYPIQHITNKFEELVHMNWSTHSKDPERVKLINDVQFNVNDLCL